MPAHEAEYVFRQVVEAMYHMDMRGVAHCDLKPENIVIDEHLKVCRI